MVINDSKGSILFVEEDQDTCELISTILKFAGYRTLIASSWLEGLRLAEGERFQLILLDWLFEDGEGLDLCRRIREFDGDTPVFFFTGLTYNPDLNKVFEVGAQGFFVQPLEIADVITVFPQFLKGGTY